MTFRAQASTRADERGVALIVTLLVVTLLSVIVTEFTYTTGVHASLARNNLSAVQADYLARSGVAMAELALVRDLYEEERDDNPRRGIDTLDDPWAIPTPLQAIGEGFGSAGFYVLDATSKLNVNSLAIDVTQQSQQVVLEARKELFQAVFDFVGIEPNLLFPLLDWLDRDSNEASQSGAEKPYYIGLSPPYLPRNGPLLTLDELALVRGFDEITPQQWMLLRDLLTVHPDTSHPDTSLEVNVNTTSLLLLTAVFSFYDTPELAQAVVSERETVPFRNPGDLEKLPGMAALKPEIKRIFQKFNSDLFEIRATGVAGDVERGLVVKVTRDRRERGRFQIHSWKSERFPRALTSETSSGGIPPLAP